MPRIDDYIAARNRAVEALATKNIDAIAKRSGFDQINDISMRIPFLNRTYCVSYPHFVFTDTDSDAPIPLQEQVLILHYLMGNGPEWLKGQWVAYREIQGAQFYYSAFIKRAVDPLKKTFGQSVQPLIGAAGKLNGRPIEAGDAGFEFLIFPKTPVQLIVYQGDDEFPAEASILFDASIGEILSPEDIAWMAGMLVYRLMALK
ncbi:MAG: DUF3786 domain-containing protein [Desulfatirhabdiaceae bacterium]